MHEKSTGERRRPAFSSRRPSTARNVPLPLSDVKIVSGPNVACRARRSRCGDTRPSDGFASSASTSARPLRMRSRRATSGSRRSRRGSSAATKAAASAAIGEVRRHVAAGHGRVDVHVDERARRGHAVAARRHLAEAAADRERRVARGRDVAGERRRGVAEAGPERERVRLREDALALERRRHGRLEALGESDEVGLRGPEPDVEKGPLRGPENLRGAFDAFRRQRRGRLGGGRDDLRLVTEEVLVGGHLDEDGTGRPGARDPAGAADDVVEVRAARAAASAPSSRGARVRAGRRRAAGRPCRCRAGCRSRERAWGRNRETPRRCRTSRASGPRRARRSRRP